MDPQKEVESATMRDATPDQEKAVTSVVDQPAVEHLADKEQHQGAKSKIAQETGEQQVHEIAVASCIALVFPKLSASRSNRSR